MCGGGPKKSTFPILIDHISKTVWIALYSLLSCLRIYYILYQKNFEQYLDSRWQLNALKCVTRRPKKSSKNICLTLLTKGIGKLPSHLREAYRHIKQQSKVYSSVVHHNRKHLQSDYAFYSSFIHSHKCYLRESTYLHRNKCTRRIEIFTISNVNESQTLYTSNAITQIYRNT